MKENLKREYLEFIQDRVNNFDYSDIDGFCEDNELLEDEVEELLSLRLRVEEVI
jgi:hypothetical protein